MEEAGRGRMPSGTDQSGGKAGTAAGTTNHVYPESNDIGTLCGSSQG